jgi:hypothetical protein
MRSQPVSLGEGTYAGTFVIGFKEVASAKTWNDNVMRKFADLASDAIEQHRNGRDLRLGAAIEERVA